MAQMTEQEWRCDKCKVNSIVYVFQGDGIFDVENRIHDQHKQLSPDCDNPVKKIRVLNNS